VSAPRYLTRPLERARQERAAAKRERRQARRADEAAPDTADATPSLSETQVLEALADLHRRYDAEEITLEELESARAELVQHLRID
jgi:hypothetical protein